MRAEDISSLDDIRRIPFMTRDDWMESQIADPPFGEVLAQPPAAAMRYHTTSGTSGSRPLAVLDGPKDWEWIAEMWCYALWGFGIRPGDSVFFAFSYGTFVGFWGAHYAAEKLGCLVLPGGNMTTEARVRQIMATGHDRRLLHADLRAAHGAGGPVARHRPRQRPRPARAALGRARRLHPRDEAAHRGAVGREGGRHGGHDRGRHDHHVRVRPPARWRAHHRGPLPRGGRSTPRPTSRSPTARRASASSPPSGVGSCRSCATGRAISSAACPRPPAAAGGPSTSTTAASAGASTT